MDTLINPRAVAGDNQPPLAERLAADHADLKKRADEAAELVPEELRAIVSDEDGALELQTSSRLVSEIVAPIVSEASSELISVLDQTTVEDLVRRAEGLSVFDAGSSLVDFTI